ncbi:uncharacterized protein [Pseudorasbora parva]|uniref:uncharacterized protein isoform X3 n=1 Tax=Pseudorasbora parva TaxID=51549 RepID=UPI00351E5347
MLTFEALLVKELQKQQSRAEFCDIVLQTQGVSVPMHSCVLSAFSPWLCGTLSALPSPQNGQRRMIEVQAVEACTLLSLVSLLYSGQFKEDKEEVLLAACKLGINIPQREAKRLATEQTTQTEWTKEVAERECQTESDLTFPSESQTPKETSETETDPLSWKSDQGLCTYTNGSDIPLATLQNGQGNPENMPSFQVMDVVPETTMYPTDTDLPPRRRGRPRTRPLPQQNFPPNFSGTSTPEQKTMNLPAPSLMHTAPLPATNQNSLTQPIDWLIDDIIAELPFMPNNQQEVMNTVTVDTNMDHPSGSSSSSSVKVTDLGIVQPQSEVELTDIFESFLRTFEQHVSTSDSGVRDGIMPNVTDCSQTCGHTNTSNAHATSMNATTPESKVSLPKNGPQVSSVHKPQNPSSYWQVSGVTVEKSLAQQGEENPKTGRMTRSQSRKRKLEVIEELPKNNEHPAKRKRERKKECPVKPKVEESLPREKKRRTRKLHSEQNGTSSTVDSSSSVANALRRVINTASARNVNCSTKTTFQKTIQKTLDGSKSSELHDRKESSLVKKKQVGHAKRDMTKTLLEVQCSTGTSQPKRPVTKNKTTGSRPALSAFELMKKILENQQNKEEEQKGEDHRMRTVIKRRGKERLPNTQEHGAEVKMTDNRERNGRIMVEEHNNDRINQKDEETKGRLNEAGNQMSICLQQTLPSAKDCSMSNGERLMENSYNKARLETADFPNDSLLQRCSTEGVMLKNTSDVPFVSHALDPTVPLEKLRNTQGSTDSSEEEEDVDVVEVSGSLSEVFPVLPVTVDIVPSTEEEDEDEDYEIDVISLGSN